MEHKGIIVENVYKSFGKETVLEDVSLSIPPGEVAVCGITAAARPS